MPEQKDIPKNEIIHGDCIEEMKKLDENSVDAIVTDPPYGLAFMSKKWDKFSPREFQEFSEKWGKEALRVLKSGGYLLAFSGTRTYHRMVVGLEDAGFEIKDTLAWLYGSGFPKSHDISKAIDKHFGKKDEREKIRPKKSPDGTKYSDRQPNEWKPQGFEEREDYKKDMFETAPATEEAKKWQGWGTALKPAHEPIVLAQKPREGTYAENVLKHGVGGLNIDGCRIGFESKKDIKQGFSRSKTVNKAESSVDSFGVDNFDSLSSREPHDKGRWPANVILDPKAGEMLDEQSGETKSSPRPRHNNAKEDTFAYGDYDSSITTGFNDSGGASRFFYCAKAHKSERNAGLEDLEDVNMGQSGGARQALKEGKKEYLQNHIGLNKIKKVKNDIATLKPINLMRYLIRLVTPPEGTVLDPFAGSGTTGCACEIEGFNYILIEKRERFAKVIAPKRCEYWSNSENWDKLKDHKELPNPRKKKNREQHKTLEAFQDA